MSIKARLAALEKRIAAAEAQAASDKPFLITFSIMTVVSEDDERFYTWQVTDTPGAIDSPRLTYGGAVTFYAANQAQFQELREQYQAERGDKSLLVTY